MRSKQRKPQVREKNGCKAKQTNKQINQPTSQPGKSKNDSEKKKKQEEKEKRQVPQFQSFVLTVHCILSLDTLT